MSSGLSPSPFVNRKPELRSFEKFLAETGSRCLILAGQPNSGLTSFLSYLEQNYETTDRIIVRVEPDQYNFKNIYDDFFNEVDNKSPKSRQKRKKLKILEGAARASAATLWAVPTVGAAASFLASVAIDKFVKNFESEEAAKFAAAARILEEFQIFILIDQAHLLDENATKLFNTAAGFENVHFVLAYKGGSDARSVADLVDRAEANLFETVLLPFHPPGTAFVREYLEKNGASDLFDPDALANECNGNAYRLANRVRKRQKSDDSASNRVSPAVLQIVGYLRVAETALRESEIESIATEDEVIYTHSPNDIRRAIAEAIQLGLIQIRDRSDGDVDVMLRSHSGFMDDNNEDQYVRDLQIADLLYRYFDRVQAVQSTREDPRVASLLYRLAERVDPPDRGRRALIMVSAALALGSVGAAQRFIERGARAAEIRTLQDYLVRTTFALSSKSYEEALALLDDPPVSTWREYRFCRVLRAVALNRCRQHERSLEESEALIASSEDADELVVIGTYYIGGLVHESKVSAAQEAYWELRSRVEASAHAGYFVRNAAAAFEPERAVDMLADAERRFQASGDYFGRLTVKANQGAYAAQLGDYGRAERLSAESYDGLKVFGLQHVCEALGNLGLARLLGGDIGGAYRALATLDQVAGNNLPRVYAQMNLATVKAYRGETDAAESMMIQALEGIRSVNVPDGRQRVIANAALVLHALGRRMTYAQHLRSEAEQDPYTKDPEQTFRALRYIDSHECGAGMPPVAQLPDIYSAGFMQYWTLTPSEILPSHLWPR